jgi:hypothetical protein
MRSTPPLKQRRGVRYGAKLCKVATKLNRARSDDSSHPRNHAEFFIDRPIAAPTM